MIITNILKFANNYLKVFYFYLVKKCKVLYFEVPPELLLGILNYDIIYTVSLKIESAQNTDLDIELTEDLKNIDDLKEILKIGWLIQDIKKHGMKNPLQLVRRGDLYFCHPGTNRVLVSCYIVPEKNIRGIYLWYKDLDPDPLLLPYSKEIKNPFKFISLYTKSKKFKFVCKNITNDLDTSDKEIGDLAEGNAMFNMIKRCFQETTKTPNHLFLMGWDRIQWEKTKGMKLKDVIQFIDENTCIYGGIKFIKKKGTWITET